MHILSEEFIIQKEHPDKFAIEKNGHALLDFRHWQIKMFGIILFAATNALCRDWMTS